MEKVRKRILVVDDSPHIRGLVTLILSSEGYEVIAAENGSEALQKINGNCPDLVITDLKMPVMDGFELIRELSTDEECRDIPIIVLTGEYMPEEYRLSRACEVIMKPFIPRMLLDAVERFLYMNKTDNRHKEVFYGYGQTARFIGGVS